MVVDESIPLSELHNQIYKKFEINCDEFKLKLSVCRKNRESIGLSYVKDDEDLEAFLLGRLENTIDTTLHVSKEPRRAIEGNVGSNDQFVNKLQAEELASIEDEVADKEENNEEEEDDEDEEAEEDEENNDHVDDACLWHDPFFDRHNLEMEILDKHVDLVDVPIGVSVVGDEESM